MDATGLMGQAAPLQGMSWPAVRSVSCTEPNAWPLIFTMYGPALPLKEVATTGAPAEVVW
jgi:hypothetical protein